MQQVKDLITLPKREGVLPPQAPRPAPAIKCKTCNDVGFVYVAGTAPGQPNYGQARPCPTCNRTTAQRAAEKLQALDGLRPHERQYTIAELVPDDIEPAIDAVEQGIATRSGLITLAGTYGVGKTHLLIAAVNALRDQGVQSIYTTTLDLLNWLRNSFEGTHGEFDQRWSLLTSTPVLAIDELDAFYATEWAAAQFQALLDNRWRDLNAKLTLCALNTPTDNLRTSKLPGKVISRLQDGRARLVYLNAPDMRPAS